MDGLLQNLGGCGRFQILFTFFVLASQVSVAFSTLFMAFGAYSPGWRCPTNAEHDKITATAVIPNNSRYSNSNLNETTSRLNLYNNSTFNNTHIIMYNDVINSTSTSTMAAESFPVSVIRNDDDDDDRNKTTSSLSYVTDDKDPRCSSEFKSCQTVIDFNPEASTIATEFGLVCDQSWILSLITSIQMAGTLVGAAIVGYLGDTFGRKRTLYSSVVINAVLLFLSIFSTSWQMFTGLRFFLGISNGVISFLPHAYVSEFVVQKWRSVMGSLPIWTLGTAIFSVAGMILRDWRQLHVFNAALSILCFLPVFWVPESMRWLMVQKEKEKSTRVAEKIARVNGLNSVPLDEISRISGKVNEELEAMDTPRISQKVMLLQLFKKNRRVISIAVGAVWFMNDLVYFVTSFGVSDMPGDFYTNMIIISVTDLPGNFFGAAIPNIFGRKRSLVATLLLLSVSLFVVLATDLLSHPSRFTTVAILVLIILVRTFQNITFCILIVYVNELYPTVIRSTASGYGGFVGSLGSILAPYLLPTTSGYFYISYSVMASLALFCSLLSLFLPETKGKEMPDT